MPLALSYPAGTLKANAYRGAYRRYGGKDKYKDTKSSLKKSNMAVEYLAD
jgi:hypothetical protein